VRRHLAVGLALVDGVTGHERQAERERQHERRQREPAPPRGQRRGLGLDGMAERARLVGGELDVRSAPGAGTEVTMRLS
jgi:hypothetical protein